MSFNDPQWGKRDDDKRPQNDQEGPPDLDVIWQNINRRLNEMFGEKGKNGGNGRYPPSGNRPRIPGFSLSHGGVAWIIAAAILLWGASGLYKVDEGSRGVVTRFGKYMETTTSGLRWHLPFPIEDVDIVPFTPVRSITIGYRGDLANRIDREATMLTADENIIDILFVVQYDLHSAEAYVFNNRDPDIIVSFVAETAIREVIGKYGMDDALYRNREAIATDTRRLMQLMLDNYGTGETKDISVKDIDLAVVAEENNETTDGETSAAKLKVTDDAATNAPVTSSPTVIAENLEDKGTGINVIQVALQSIQPPDRVQAAFDDAVKAGQDQERMINEGEAYYNDVVPRADGIASRLLEEAGGYSQEIINRSKGDARRFEQLFAEYKKAPEVTRNRLYLDTMQTVFANTSKVILDQKGGNNLIFLPLDKLMEMSGAQQQSQTTVPVSVTPQTSDSSSTTSYNRNDRDALRNRDR
ncbi:MAG: FtsH protease activity modulator HflK [Burkholderiales bacterium]|jgi:membrane protease subunit HflK|nr:FtsH protease activity modulator HflK [Burkholderiales bacterium]